MYTYVCCSKATLTFPVPQLRSHAEQEVKTLRSEVSRKKANMALTQARANSLRHLPLLPHDLVVRM